MAWPPDFEELLQLDLLRRIGPPGGREAFHVQFRQKAERFAQKNGMSLETLLRAMQRHAAFYQKQEMDPASRVSPRF